MGDGLTKVLFTSLATPAFRTGAGEVIEVVLTGSPHTWVGVTLIHLGLTTCACISIGSRKELVVFHRRIIVV